LVVHDDGPVGLDGVRVCFDDDRVVADAGIALVATLAGWRWLRHHHLPGWWPTGRETVLYNPAAVSTIRYRYRAARISTPWDSGWVATSEPTRRLERLEHLIAP
jgi:hypothetical protein